MIREEKRWRGKVLKLNMDTPGHIDIQFNDWVYGGLVYDAVDDEFHIIFFDPEEGKPYVTLPEETSISESTFKKDVEGVMVFEKDILSKKFPSGETEFYIVINDNGALGICPLGRYKANLWQNNTIPIHTQLAEDIITKSKVVGNTVDEPEWTQVYV
jgi:hypothetical protein